MHARAMSLPEYEYLGQELGVLRLHAADVPHGDELRAAAAAGARVIAHREDEARKQAMAEAEWTLQGLADRGREALRLQLVD